MSVLDWFRRKPQAPEGPDALRERLFVLVAESDGRALEALCRERRAEIVAQYPSWQKVPVPIREQPEKLQRYANGLIGVARFFAEALADRSLLDLLEGKSGGNPLDEWQDGLRAGRALLQEGKFPEAVGHLEALLSKGEKLKGTAVARPLVFTLETLAEARFHGGDAAGAVEPLKRALAICREQGDVEGVVACTGSLFETQRYLGEFERAASYSDERAAALAQLGHAGESARARAMAARVRAGEPLNRVVVMIDGERFELGEMPARQTVRAQFIFERNRLTLRRATMLIKQASELASAGRYEPALAGFEEAIAVDSFDPHARFLAALTLLHLKRYKDAVARYGEVERLAPGWYHCRADAWMAEQLERNALPHTAFLALVRLEDGNLAPTDALNLAEETGRQFRLAAAHLHRGRALLKLGRRDEAVAAFRDGLAIAEEPDVRSRLAGELAGLLDGAARDEQLDVAMDARGNLVAAAQARYLRNLRRAN